MKFERFCIEFNRWRTFLKWSLPLCVIMVVILPGTGWSQHDHQSKPNSAPVVGTPAVSFELKSLEGKSVGLAGFRGKPLVLNFFASWCDPCRDEMPLLNELASKGVKDGYSLIGIAVEDTRTAVAEYAREAKLTFPIALDLNSAVKRSYRIFGPPATFLSMAEELSAMSCSARSHQSALGKRLGESLLGPRLRNAHQVSPIGENRVRR